MGQDTDLQIEEARYRDLREVAAALGIAVTKGGKSAFCPGHSRGPGKGSASITFGLREGRQVWRCHSCGEGGDVIEMVRFIHDSDFLTAVEYLTGPLPPAPKGVKYEPLEEAVEVDIDTRAAAVAAFFGELPPLSGFGLDWLLREKAITADTARRFDLREIDRKSAQRGMTSSIAAVGADAAEALGLVRVTDGRQRPGMGWFYSIAIPYFDATGRAVHLQARQLQRGEREPKAKYLHIRGKVPDPWGLHDLGEAERVFVVEGALDAAVLRQDGKASIGVPGTGWFRRERFTEVLGSLPPGAVPVIGCDDDDAGRDAQGKAEGWARDAGVSPLRVVWPGPCDDGESWGKDWCDLYLAGLQREIKIVEPPELEEEEPRDDGPPAVDAPHPADDDIGSDDGDEGGRCFLLGDDVEIGLTLLKDIGEAVSVEDALWLWSGVGWSKMTDESAMVTASRYSGRGVGRLKPKPLRMSVSKIRGSISIAKAHVHEPDWFADAPSGVPFLTGMLRLNEDGSTQWEDHTQDHRQRLGHHLPFDPPTFDEGCPDAWGGFLEQTWSGCEDLVERAALLQEWLGAALFGFAYKHKTALLLTGRADTGKSTLLSVIEALFPKDSRNAIGLQSMANEYHRAMLSGVRINVVNELPARDLLDSEAAKAVISGDPVDARHPAGRPFTLRCRSAHVFAANDLPRSLDRALVRRLAVLDCPNVVPREMQDTKLREKLIAELPAIAQWAVLGAQRLQRRGHYIIPGSAEAAAQEWSVDSDSASGFADECLDKSESATSMRALYGVYRNWCDGHGHKPMASSQLGKRLRFMGHEPGARRADGRTMLVALKGS